MPPQPPAYNAVPARTTFIRPAAQVGVSSLSDTRPSGFNGHSQQPTAPPESKPKKVQWSEAVKAYVRRAFEPDNEIPGISQKEMTDKLKEIISYYAERQMDGQIDWSNYPLPQFFILQDRNKAPTQRPVASGPSYANDAQPAYVTPTNTSSAVTPQSSKRKSQDMENLQATPADSSVPPWRKTDLQDRITYGNGHKDKRHKKNDSAKDSSSKFDQADLEKRRQRFQLDKSGSKSTPPWNSPRTDSESDMATGPVVGTNQSLEKSYFRLTAPPKAETVRPQSVLEKTLVLLRNKWKEEKNYNYICNQFKSLRQDLTVQHIKNPFTVKVYETHARIALEKGDLGEYNQCQTQLKALYLQKLGGNPGEFLGYRILYFVYTCNKTDMNDLLAELTPADKAQKAVKHALEVRSSLAMGNYHKFFRLYLQAPNMGGYLMDMFIERERLHALANISRAYAPCPPSPASPLTVNRYMSVALRFLTDELGFESDGECRQFLNDHGAENIIEEKTDKNGATLRVRVKEGAANFERLRAAAFSKVDIKGQI